MHTTLADGTIRPPHKGGIGNAGEDLLTQIQVCRGDPQTWGRCLHDAPAPWAGVAAPGTGITAIDTIVAQLAGGS